METTLPPCDMSIPSELLAGRLYLCIVQGYRREGRPVSYPMVELPDGSFAGLTWDGWHLLRRAQEANVQVRANVASDSPAGRYVLVHITLLRC